MSAPQKLFIIYARKDWRHKDLLLKSLKLLQNQGLIEPWHDNDIKPGDEWDKEIREHLRSADIILPIISFEFINSNYINDVEIVEAFDRHSRREVVIIPIIADAFPWWDYPNLKGLELLPANAIPIEDWPTKTKAMTSIYEGVRRIVLEKNKHPKNINSNNSTFQSPGIKKIFLENSKPDNIEPINNARDERKKRDALRLFKRAQDSTDLNEKLDLFSQAISINKDYDEAFCCRGIVQIDLREYSLASQDFDESIRINPGYSNAYFHRGWIKLKSNQFKEAVLDFDQSIQLYNQDAKSFCFRGLAKLAIEQFAEAKNDFNQSIYLNSSDANAYLNRGIANERLEFWDMAQNDYKKTLEIEPDNDHAKKLLKNLRSKLTLNQ